jgi:riboflavin kinase/FMN adenylyltransferase
MQVFRGLESYQPPPGGTAVSIGNFDGCHRGHAQIFATAVETAQQRDLTLVAVTFEPHPLAVLNPGLAPARLNTLNEKLFLLEQFHADQAIVLPVDRALLGIRAPDFLASFVAHVRPRAFVEGPDFNFGRGREGDIDTLRQYAAQWDYTVHAVDAVHAPDLASHPAISSSSIRQALRDGRIEEANAMLGRPHRVTGIVGFGQGRGAGIGFPTANLEQIPQLLPQEAVYAAVAQTGDDRLFLAAVNVGPQPTFDQSYSRVEAHLLDCGRDLRGSRLALYLLARLRGQVRFSGPAALVSQLEQDVAATRHFHKQIQVLRQQPLLPL